MKFSQSLVVAALASLASLADAWEYTAEGINADSPNRSWKGHWDLVNFQGRATADTDMYASMGPQDSWIMAGNLF